MKKLTTAILAFLLYCGGMTAEVLQWKNVSTGDASAVVLSMAFDGNGLMWLGTGDGLFYYDGCKTYRFGASLDLGGHQIYSLVFRGETLYLGTNNGLFVLDTHSGKISGVAGGSPSEIRAMALDNDRLWIGSLSGLYGYDIVTGVLTHADLDLPHEAVYSILLDGKEMYLGTYGGLCRHNVIGGGRIETIDLGKWTTSVFVNSLAIDRDEGFLYVGTEQGLLKYDMARKEIADGILKGSCIKSMTKTNGNIFVGTDNGLYVVGRSGVSIYRHDSVNPYSIANNVVWSLIADDKGNLAAGTEAGISITGQEGQLTVMELSDLTGRTDGNRIFSILRDSGGVLWLGGINGIIRYDGSHSDWFMPGEKDRHISNNRIRDIFQSRDGEIWLATDGGLNRYDSVGRRFVNYAVRDSSGILNANWCYSIVEDGDGLLWLGGYLGGVMAVDRKDLVDGGMCVAVKAVNDKNGLPNNLVGRIVMDDDDCKWVILFRDGQVYRIKGNDTERIAAEGLGGFCPTGIIADGGDVWVSGGNRVVRISRGSGREDVFSLPDGRGNIKAICKVRSMLWIVASAGVWALDSDSGEFVLLPVPAKVYSSIYYDGKTGNVLLGALDEVVSVNPDWILDTSHGRGVGIMRITVNGKVISTPFVSGEDASRITLASSSDNLKLELGTLDYNPARTHRFGCLCTDGRDTVARVLLDGGNVLDVPNLKPGRYELAVYCCGDSSGTRTIRLRVRVPLYARWYVIILYCVLIVISVAFVIFYTRRREQQSSRAAVMQSRRIEHIMECAPIVAESVSERQLDEVTRTIEKYIDNYELNVGFLCKKTGLDTKQLYRLVKKYVGVTPVAYIRRIRMKKAAGLLVHHNFTVSEIAYMVGFNDSSYFSKCFIMEYGCKPTQYQENHRKSTE